MTLVQPDKHIAQDKFVWFTIIEMREMAHIKEFATKVRCFKRYSSRVVPREMEEGGLIPKQNSLNGLY